jgi:hypothetical protein
MSLQSFTFDALAEFTAEGEFGPSASPDLRGFYVGRDDVHGVLLYLLSNVTLSLKLNMFGYDDDELAGKITELVENPKVFVQVTLDKSQSGGVHEKKVIASQAASDPVAFAADFAIGQSASHQISHTKGGVLDGLVAFEGSTNWSASGQGTGIGLRGTANQPGFKAQSNTLWVTTNPYEISKFSARLDYEHAVAKSQKQPNVT